MAEAPAPVAAAAPGMGGLFGDPNLWLSIFIIVTIAVLLIPLPTFLVDVGLTLSITLSVLILMSVLFMNKALEFSAFPTVLLFATLLRLSLNIATTRLILTEGHTGTDAAGQVVKSFAEFVMGGDFVIGVIVFAILTTINFIVITKGAGRIAEVSARFTLDALPGKQMAIDADLSSGLIDEQDAKKRRRELEEESRFYGAMDGAAKFVRGDAIAGLIIIFINIIGGIIIGTFRHQMGVMEAADSYVRLSIGDGLVTQVPAIIVSIASGLLVTKTNPEDGLPGNDMFRQLGGYPVAMGLTGIVLLALGLVPGMPFLPFFMLGGTVLYIAYTLYQTAEKKQAGVAEAAAEAALPPPVAEEPIAKSLAMDHIRLELGYALIGMINSEAGKRLTDQIKGLRRQLATDMGFIMPAVRIQDNLQLPPSTYMIRIKEIEAGRGELRPGMLLCMDPRGEAIALPGEATTEPTFGLPAMWVDPAYREEALFKGYTVVDAATVITTHLTEVMKDNMPELLSYTETQKLLDELSKEQQKLVADLIPSQMTVGAVQRVLQGLLGERISIRDLPTILEGIAEINPVSRNITVISEHVRSRLARQISESNTGPAGYIPLLTLSPEWEQAFADSIIGSGEERQLALPPSRLQQFIAAVRQTFDRHAMMGEQPVLLTSPGIRSFVRSIIERFRPSTVVLSQNEIHPKARIRTLGQI